jgi:hypothetical protein
MLHERAIYKGSIVIRVSRIIFFSLFDKKDDKLMSKTIRKLFIAYVKQREKKSTKVLIIIS